MGAEDLQKSIIEQFESMIKEPLKGKANIYEIGQSSKNGIFEKSVFVGEDAPPADVIECLLKNESRHFIQLDSNNCEHEINFAFKILNNPGLIFDDPITCLLDPFDLFPIVHEKQKFFSTLEQKEDLLEGVREVLDGFRDSIILDSVAVADELITNAIYHSAIESAANRPIHLVAKEAQFCVARTENELLIMCADPNGTLDPRRLLEKIYDCYVNEVETQINQGPGGAGIGSYMVHQLGCSYTVAVDPGNKTLIGVKLPLKLSNRKRLNLSKNLHIVIKEPS